MGRRSARNQLQSLRRLPKDKAKDYERWMGQFATRREVDEMIRFYLGQYVEAVGKAEVAVDAELPVDSPSEEAV